MILKEILSIFVLVGYPFQYIQKSPSYIVKVFFSWCSDSVLPGTLMFCELMCPTCSCPTLCSLDFEGRWNFPLPISPPPLHWTSPDCTALNCTIIHCTALNCTILHCTVLSCTIPHYTSLHRTILYCTELHCTELHGTRPHHFCISATKQCKV